MKENKINRLFPYNVKIDLILYEFQIHFLSVKIITIQSFFSITVFCYVYLNANHIKYQVFSKNTYCKAMQSDPCIHDSSKNRAKNLENKLEK